jgi:hypothetical protein
MFLSRTVKYIRAVLLEVHGADVVHRQFADLINVFRTRSARSDVVSARAGRIYSREEA